MPHTDDNRVYHADDHDFPDDDDYEDDGIEEGNLRRNYTAGGVFVGSLGGLFTHGDLIITEGKDFVALDLTMRRSGVTISLTGPDLADVIRKAWYEVYDHVDALRHLADLGIEPSDIGRLAGYARDDFDPAFAPLPQYEAPPAPEPEAVAPDPAFLGLPTTPPVLAAAGEPVDGAVGDGYVWALLVPVRVGRA